MTQNKRSNRTNQAEVRASFGELLGLEILEAREAKGWTQLALSEQAYGDHQAERRIRDYELGKVKRPQAKVYLQICDAVGITRQRINELKEISGDARSINRAEIDALRKELGSLEEAISNVGIITREKMEALARHFEIVDYYNISDNKLTEILIKKADDYRDLEAKFEGVGEQLVALSGLKSEARKAIREGNLAEVEQILAHVQATEIEESAETAGLRASNALLRGYAQQAFDILSAAADSFGAINAQESGRKRVTYARQLLGHGIRYGDGGLRFAQEMIEQALVALGREGFNAFRLEAIDLFSIILVERAARESSEIGTEFLNRAVNLLNGTLCQIERDKFLSEWVDLHITHGRALRYLGVRVNTDIGNEYLERSVKSFEDALSAAESQVGSSIFGKIHFNLGTVLNYLGDRLDDERRNEMIGRSIDHLRMSIGLLEDVDNKDDLGTALNNLAVALYDLARGPDCRDGVKLLSEASDACDRAFMLRDRLSNPMGWAQTQNNKGIVLIELGLLTKKLDTLSGAIDAFNAALEIRTREENSLFWAVSKANLSRAMLATARVGHQGSQRSALLSALTEIKEGLSVLESDESSMYFKWSDEIRREIEEELMSI